MGSWILEEPIHYFDLARWYLADLGDPLAVYARGAGRGPDLHESIATLVTFPHGGYASISQTTAGAEHHLLAEVVGTETSLRVVWSGASDRAETPTHSLQIAANDLREDIPLEGTSTETGDPVVEIGAMVRCVKEGGLAIGVKERNRLIVGGEEIEL